MSGRRPMLRAAPRSPAGTAGLAAVAFSVAVAAALAAVLVHAAPAVALEVPYLSGRVVDEAGLVPPEVAERIDAELADLERETGAQVAVLTVPTLGGESLEGFSLKVANTWALGRAGADDGVLLFIARDDRTMRIEVGRGLERTLTDERASQILSQVIRPRFRAGDFGGGVEAGVDAIAGVVRGEPVKLVEAPPGSAGGGAELDWMGRVFGSIVFLTVVGVHSLVALGTRGGAGWFLYVFLMFFWAAFPAALVSPLAGVVAWLLWTAGFPFLRLWLGKTAAGRRLVEKRPWMKNLSGSGTWFAGGRSSGGSFSSGGGFSGGGGSFGGGGSSGSW